MKYSSMGFERAVIKLEKQGREQKHGCEEREREKERRTNATKKERRRRERSGMRDGAGLKGKRAAVNRGRRLGLEQERGREGL